MDAFFAAVEQRDNPSFRGRPVVVGSLPGTRGVVSTCSYEARRFGVRSAMPINEAVRRLPADAVFVLPDGKKYSLISRQIMEIFSDFSPHVEQASVDEAFIDMTGSERLFGTPLETAQKLAAEIVKRLNLTASIGIAPNKFLAKIASDMNKPSGITATPFDPESIRLFLAPLPVERLWGVGPSMQNNLALLGVQTVKQLQELPESLLCDRFGSMGSRLAQIRFGIDSRPVEQHEGAKSISREHTFNENEYSRDVWIDSLRWICDDVTRQARKANLAGRTVTLTFRTPDFVRKSSSITIPIGTDCSEEMFRIISDLAAKALAPISVLRLIGAGLSGFHESESEQLSLFSQSGEQEERENWRKRDRVVDLIQDKFGASLLVRGRDKNKKQENRRI